MKQVLQGDCMEVLKTLQDKSVNCIVTSPPYYGLRDYGTGLWVGGDAECPHRRISKYSDKTITGHAQKELAGNVGDAIYKTVCPLCGAVRIDKQIGLEETPEGYIEKLVSVFRECKRVLNDEGTLWINIGDSYNQNTQQATKKQGNEYFNKNRPSREQTILPKRKMSGSCKQKDLIGIPWMLAFALRTDGWYLRQDIIWHKPNPMPESVKDRCTKSHEYIFLLSKQPHYYFNHEAIQEESKWGGALTEERTKDVLNIMGNVQVMRRGIQMRKTHLCISQRKETSEMCGAFRQNLLNKHTLQHFLKI